MARPREFDKAEVVARAAELFRLKGYQATSMRDLISHVGLSSSSIYAAFGGKYGLFMAALAHGAAQDKAMITAALDNPAGVLAGISALYDGLIDSLLEEHGAAASLTLRAALENLDSEDKEQENDVLDALRAHFTDIAAVVASGLDQAEKRGELRLNQGASDLALFLLLNVFNLTFVVKLTRDRQRLAAYVQAALDAVTGDAGTGGAVTRGAVTGDAVTTADDHPGGTSRTHA